MRASQFVRRGLVAFAAVATISLGFADLAGAQAGGVRGATSPGAVTDGDDAIVYVPTPGYSYDVVFTDGERTALLGVGVTGGVFPVVVQFLPDFDGAAIIDPAGDDVFAQRQ
jgi:hypothetical protein